MLRTCQTGDCWDFSPPKVWSPISQWGIYIITMYLRSHLFIPTRSQPQGFEQSSNDLPKTRCSFCQELPPRRSNHNVELEIQKSNIQLYQKYGKNGSVPEKAQTDSRENPLIHRQPTIFRAHQLNLSRSAGLFHIESRLSFQDHIDLIEGNGWESPAKRMRSAKKWDTDRRLLEKEDQFKTLSWPDQKSPPKGWKQWPQAAHTEVNTIKRYLLPSSNCATAAVTKFQPSRVFNCSSQQALPWGFGSQVWKQKKAIVNSGTPSFANFASKKTESYET